jgi:WD40 repeat protein
LRVAAISPDGRWCANFGVRGASLLRDRFARTNLNVDLSLRQAGSATFSPDGKLLVAASWLGTGKVWSTDSWREVSNLHGFLLGIDSVAFSGDGLRLVAGSGGKEALKLWDVASFQELLTLEADGSTYFQTAFSPDENVLGSRNASGVLHLWRAPSWEEIASLEANQKPGGPAP